MGWDRRGYYYRVRKVNGRVVREYVGRGKIASMAQRMDEIEQERRELKRLEAAAQKQEAESADVPLDDFIAATDLLAQAALLAAGYYKHNRGEWRKKRVHN